MSVVFVVFPVLSVLFLSKTHLTDPKADERLKFESTGEHVPLEQLSPRARDMCRGAEILRVRTTDKGGKTA